MSAPLPFGAKTILEARKRGKRPADMVLVSMIGKLANEVNPVVQVSPGVRHDWSWSRDLVLCFWTTPNEYEPTHILDCKKCSPREMYLWDAANEKGYDIHVWQVIESVEKHPRNRERWEYKIHAFRWTGYQENKFTEGELVWS